MHVPAGRVRTPGRAGTGPRDGRYAPTIGDAIVPDPTEEPRSAGRRVVAKHVAQFAASGAAALVIVGLATTIASRRIGEREGIVDARTQTVIKAQGLVQPAFSDAVLLGGADAVATLDDVVRSQVLDEDLVRVKIWSRDGTIVYSDESRLVGDRYALGADETAALETGAIEAEVSDLTKPENRYERESGKLLEVYLPIRSPSGEPVLFEAYYRYSLVERNGSRLWRSFAPIALGSLLLLALVQIALGWSLARRLRMRLLEREQLLRRALRASDAERRRIASDLHDGAVQDLAGVAYSLSAAARQAGSGGSPAAADLEAAAESVRDSIRSLRSLIVDIYPPDFSETPFESALAELLARATDAGLDVGLDVEIRSPLPDSTARLLYRAAQEGVRNVLAHAGATALNVRVTDDGATAVLEVTDDGVGLDTGTLESRTAAGHVGLRALRGLVVDAGGRLEVRGEPGRGTALRVEVPR